MKPSGQQLALGTAQLGLDYGITNEAGRVPAAEAEAMLDAAWAGGVRLLDTAPAYGDSEAGLGQAFARRPGRGWRVVTKTLPLRLPAIDAQALSQVDAAFRRSIAALGPVDTLLVHHADDLLVPGGEALHGWLRGQQEQGRVRCIGASIYDGAQARLLVQRYALDVVQLPASIADQRLLADGTVARLADAGIELHARSLYLQGLLLADPGFVTARFPAQAAWARRFHDECRRRALQPLQACLSFFRDQPALSVAVIGAASRAEIATLLAAWNAAPAGDWSGWAVDNPAFTDPRQWTTR